MKKVKMLFAGIMIIGLLTGCTGMNASVPVNVATDTAFVLVLQNNPQYKPDVVAGLQTIKLFLAGNVTYDALIMEISKQFGGKYAMIAVILTGYLDTDKPVSISAITMFDSYKSAVIIKIDRLIQLANVV